MMKATFSHGFHFIGYVIVSYILEIKPHFENAIASKIDSRSIAIIVSEKNKFVAFLSVPLFSRRKITSDLQKSVFFGF